MATTKELAQLRGRTLPIPTSLMPRQAKLGQLEKVLGQAGNQHTDLCTRSLTRASVGAPHTLWRLRGECHPRLLPHAWLLHPGQERLCLETLPGTCPVSRPSCLAARAAGSSPLLLLPPSVHCSHFLDPIYLPLAPVASPRSGVWSWWEGTASSPQPSICHHCRSVPHFPETRWPQPLPPARQGPCGHPAKL